MTVAAISPASAALLLLLATAAVFLCGLWLLTSSSARRSELAVRSGIELGRRRRLHERLNDRISRTGRGADLGARLRSAGVERNTAQFLLIVAGISVAAFVVVSALFPPLIGAVAAVLTWWACFAWLGRRLDKRGEELIGQLPEVARLLSGGTSAGLSIPAALELTTREIESPAREELQTVLDELSLGRPLEEALERLRRRLPSREIAVLMNTLIVQQRAGGDTVKALRDLAETLDTRRDTNREVRTLMAGAIYTAYLVPGLGVFSLLMLNTINSRTLQQMTGTAVGIVSLAVAGFIYVVAFIAIRRVTRIQV
jgi:tight adherence protein B